MLKLMVGTNFDPKLVEIFAGFNAGRNSDKIRIHEVYGSVQGLKLFGSARPDFRVPDISETQLFYQAKMYQEAGIILNYTENSPIVNKANVDTGLLKEKLDEMQQAGIGRVTLAHPLAMELVSQYSSMPIEVSTIYAVQNVYQIQELKRRSPNINKICLDVDINRDFQKLIELRVVAAGLGIEVELLANEFCIFDCVDRVQCYNEHTQVKTDAESAKFKRYPMGNCISLRQSPIEWARARFILPQHLDWYKLVAGITNFKITGRTHPTNYIEWVTRQYIEQYYDGNLLQLWADVKNIRRVANGQEHLIPDVDISSLKFTNDFLWDYWQDRKLNTDRAYETQYLSKILHVM